MNPNSRTKAPASSDELAVGHVLDAAGIPYRSVPTHTDKRCDLRADHKGTRYLIEVKGLHDNAAIRQALASGAVHEASRQTMYHGTVDERISEAVAQLQETGRYDTGALRLVALLVRTTFGPEVTASQLFGTLYGERTIWYLDTAKERGFRQCLYFAESAFFKHKSLDGALVFDSEGLPAFCINDHGPRREIVMQSGLAQWFAQHGALNDASSLDRAGKFFVADCPIDRKDTKGLHAYIRHKYGLDRSIDLHLEEHSAMSRTH